MTHAALRSVVMRTIPKTMRAAAIDRFGPLETIGLFRRTRAKARQTA
jgi:hypothetical protein